MPVFPEIMRALYIRLKLARSLQVAERGEVTSQEEMERMYLGTKGIT